MTIHTMDIQHPTLGHEHVTWDPDDPDSVAEAKSKFDAAIKQGRRAYRVDNKPEPGEPIDEFDPALTELLLVAPIAGG